MLHDYQNSQELVLGQKFLYPAEVVWVDDEYDTGIVKCRILELDKNIKDVDLPPCIPLTSFGFLAITPKKGETVRILLDRVYNSAKSVNQEMRFWIGISISDISKLDFDPAYFTGNSHEPNGFLKKGTPLSKIPTAKGTYPKKDEVAFRGRYNTDIVHKDNEILIRAGRHEVNDSKVFNKKNPAYIQVKQLKTPKSKVKKSQQTKVEIIPAKHSIVVKQISFDVKFEIIDLTTLQVVETLNNNYTNQENLVYWTKQYIKDFQKKYEQWQLETTIEGLEKLPKVYPKNKKTIRVEVQEVDTNENKSEGSIVTVVADKTFLVSNKSKFETADPEFQMSQETLAKLDEEAHPMVHGDELALFLNLLRTALAHHVHPYNAMEAIREETMSKLLSFDLTNILSKYHKLV